MINWWINFKYKGALQLLLLFIQATIIFVVQPMLGMQGYNTDYLTDVNIAIMLIIVFLIF